MPKANQVRDALEVIKEDWSKLPSFIKYCFFIAISILLAAWLLKGQDQQFDKSVALWSFCAFGLFGIILPACYWVYVAIKIRVYRIIYPIKEMGKSIKFVNVGNPVYLVDIKRMQIRWIENPRTLYDLGFFPYVWTILVPVTSLSESVSINSEKLDLGKYAIKRGLRTRYRINLR